MKMPSMEELQIATDYVLGKSVSEAVKYLLSHNIWPILIYPYSANREFRTEEVSQVALILFILDNRVRSTISFGYDPVDILVAKIKDGDNVGHG